MYPMMKDSAHYTPLLADSDSANLNEDKSFPSDEQPTCLEQHPGRRPNVFYAALVAIQAFLIIGLIGFNWSTYKKLNSAACSQVVYSPLQHLLEYSPVLYGNGFHDQMSIYQSEPSPEVDQAWEDLYNNFGLSALPKEQADLLDNKTLALSNGKYLAEFSVFHSLHCLNTIRKALRADYYADPVTGAIAGLAGQAFQEHVSHCIDDLRQSLQCASDVSVIVWRHIPGNPLPEPRQDVVHSCRNFEKIAEWARANRAVAL